MSTLRGLAGRKRETHTKSTTGLLVLAEAIPLANWGDMPVAYPLDVPGSVSTSIVVEK